MPDAAAGPAPPPVRTERDGSVLVVTLDRPERLNAFTPAMQRALIDEIDRADADDAVRAVVVTGAGRAFCAGADLGLGAATFDYGGGDGGDGHQDQQFGPAPRDAGGVLTLRLFRSKKPLVAAINGAAVGIGATMTLPMDARLASTDARIGFVFARRGIVPEAASSWFLPRLVGLPNALDWCLSGRLVDAAEAQVAGLLQAVVEPGALVDAAIARARHLSDHAAPVSAALTRAMLWRMAAAPHPMTAHRWDSRAVHALGAAPDAAEGVMSFLEKREPRFSGSVANDYPRFFPFEDEPPFT